MKFVWDIEIIEVGQGKNSIDFQLLKRDVTQLLAPWNN